MRLQALALALLALCAAEATAAESSSAIYEQLAASKVAQGVAQFEADVERLLAGVTETTLMSATQLTSQLDDIKRNVWRNMAVEDLPLGDRSHLHDRLEGRLAPVRKAAFEQHAALLARLAQRARPHLCASLAAACRQLLVVRKKNEWRDTGILIVMRMRM
eukprot:m.9155 g.9155  ORF g.9155 m.9155 type:complete len:161 (+) comp2940_c0_seq2:20-502(+)